MDPMTTTARLLHLNSQSEQSVVRLANGFLFHRIPPTSAQRYSTVELVKVMAMNRTPMEHKKKGRCIVYVTLDQAFSEQSLNAEFAPIIGWFPMDCHDDQAFVQAGPFPTVHLSEPRIISTLRVGLRLANSSDVKLSQHLDLALVMRFHQ